MLATVQDINAIMEKHYPLDLAEKWDNSGLQLGSRAKSVARVAVALDIDAHIFDQALNNKVDMIITHHPLLFQPVRQFDFDQPRGVLLKQLVEADMAVYSAHTNLDAAEKGMNQVLAEKLGLCDISPLYRYKEEDLLKIVVFVPEGYVDEVRSALCDAGAGAIGKYSDCTFFTGGKGSFKPGDHSQPFIGSQGVLAKVNETRLETVVYRRNLDQVILAMKAAHPYEEVAYDIYSLENKGKIYSMGRKGCLSHATTLEVFAQQVKQILGIDYVRVVGELDKRINRVAVVSGAGASLAGRAIENHADVIVTGDIKYHEAQECLQQNLAMIDAGHQGTEQIICPHLCALLGQECLQRGFETVFVPLYARDCFQVI